ncbi:hemerythrin domain-containing protein [Sphingomonas sp. MMS12-HWE2-04]|uniref:hemerythrin domain-containing protein n=1 Tax=Sphingomonas sp. MMS12-HWE2-04 TaxID=3234199 RepID=UPI00384F97C4
MSSIAELCAEHREVEEQARLLLRIAAAECPDSAMVAGIRWRLAQMLHDHCVREDQAVYGRLLGSGDAVAIVQAEHYREDHGGIARGVAGYIAAWPVQRIGCEWQAFGVATRNIVAMIFERIRLEERHLYAQLARVEAHRAAA